jgi:catechol 2,3-dioxygenase-like lactoylglutathione lyase family enzyme
VIIGIAHVQIAAPAGCEPAARAFYAGVLGLAELAKPEPLAARGGAWFATGSGQQLHVGVEDPFVPARKAHPALAVDAAELAQLVKRLEAGGVAVRWDRSLPDVARFYVDDPWGNRLEFLASDVAGSTSPFS